MKFFEKKCSIEALENHDYDAVFGGKYCTCGRNYDYKGKYKLYNLDSVDTVIEGKECQTDDDCKEWCCMNTAGEQGIFFYGCQKKTLADMKQCNVG